MTDPTDLYTSLADQRNAILFTHRWRRGLPDEEAEERGDLQACLVGRGKQFVESVDEHAIKFLNRAVRTLYPWEARKAMVRRHLAHEYNSDPMCVFWNDRYGTEEKVLVVLDETMRDVKGESR